MEFRFIHFFTERRSEAESYEDPKSWGGKLDEISRLPHVLVVSQHFCLGDVEISAYFPIHTHYNVPSLKILSSGKNLSNPSEKNDGVDFDGVPQLGRFLYAVKIYPGIFFRDSERLKQ